MWDLGDDFSIREMDEEEFTPLFQKYCKEFFDDVSQVFRIREVLDEIEKSKLRALSENMGTPYHLRLGVFYKDKFIGWHFGFQESAFKFYMCNTGIFSEYRRKGLYTKLVKRVLEITKDKGFQEVYSRHSLPNNAVIIPKLKCDFMISGMEMNDMFGTIVLLSYFPKVIRREVFSARTGHTKPSKEIKTLLRI